MNKMFFHIRAGFLIPMILLFFGSEPMEILIYFSAVAMHEVGHLTALSATGFRAKEITLSLTGASIRADSELIPYKKECLIFLAGPMANLLGCGIGLVLLRATFSKEGLLFFFSHALLCFFNLLPICGLDGHGALFAFLCQKNDPDRAREVCHRFHRLSLFLLLTLSLLAVVRFQNPSPLILCTALAADKKRKSYDHS